MLAVGLWAARSAVQQIHSSALREEAMNAKTRLGWVRMYEELGHARRTCLRCGITAVTLRKWVRRYAAEGEAGLEDRSKRPKRSPGRKVFEREEKLILELRRERKLGIKRLRNELIRERGLKLAIDTIHKVLVRHGENRLKRPKLQGKKKFKRYSRPVPGDRVQMDVCKIAKGVYQFTAIDDCSRMQVAKTYPRKSAEYSMKFIERVREEMPFPIQRFQTDRGQEFFAWDVQDKMRQRRIKFRPTRPRSPHLNGKVERVQKTALEEFWPTVDIDAPDRDQRLEQWVRFYNSQRPHDSLGGRSPIERVAETQQITPTQAEVDAAYEPEKEFSRTNHYAIDQAVREMRR